MLIRSVEFIKSSSKWQECPEANLPEYAFIGRSNVGKSSLINTMINRRNIAKTSQTPGKTKLINHFIVNETWYLTDLPGYGYAKVSKFLRKEFDKLIFNYILNRKNLVNLFILVDIRHLPQKKDIEFMQWCGESRIPFSIIFTKSDKLKPKIIKNNVIDYKTKLLQFWEELPQSFITSAKKKESGYQILDFIEKTNIILEKNKIKF